MVGCIIFFQILFVDRHLAIFARLRDASILHQIGNIRWGDIFAQVLGCPYAGFLKTHQILHYLILRQFWWAHELKI